jgi:hypothetical protein
MKTTTKRWIAFWVAVILTSLIFTFIYSCAKEPTGNYTCEIYQVQPDFSMKHLFFTLDNVTEDQVKQYEANHTYNIQIGTYTVISDRNTCKCTLKQ